MAPSRMVDLYSDVVTRPSAEMRQFMMDAEVGDEQRGLDPTVVQLQEQVAELLGKEAALFLPSGTMCNQVAFGVHCRPGDEIIMDASAHPFNYEAGGPALFGAQIRTISGDGGIFTVEQLTGAIRPKAYYNPRSRVLSVEQTTNYPGGICWPLETIQTVCERARQRELLRHMDGARLMNAVVATGTKACDFSAPFDSVWIDLSKGLGCPVGAVLAGSRGFIEEAWALKHRLGGAMRQAGIIAAAGIYALKNNVDRLAEDHANAKLLAEGLAAIKGIKLDPSLVQTNIVIFDVSGTGKTVVELAELLESQGVSFSPAGATLLRAITHLDVSRDDITFALGVVEKALG